MLIVNWKKHYYVPSLFYNDTRFTSTRKGKFFFLSDFVFRIIHKYCFKLCLFYYVRYLFYHRFQKMCLNINKYLFSSSFLLKQDFYKIILNFYYSSLRKKNTELVNYKIINKTKFLIHFNFFFYLLFFFKKKLFNINPLYFVFFNFYISNNLNSFKKHVFFFLIKQLISYYKIYKKKISFYYNNNIIFLLYQLNKIRFYIKYIFSYFSSIFSLSSIFKSYVKTFSLEHNICFNSISSRYDRLKFKYVSFFDLLKFKNIFYSNINWKKNYVFYFTFFANNFHNLLSYFFSLKKLKTYKSLNFLNYVNLNNLILKKNLIYKFRSEFRIFRKKLKKYRLRYIYKYYKFLIRLLYVKKNWLLGPVHKMKFFKYLFFMYRKIKLTFRKVFLLNSPYSRKKKKLSFFFNSSRIREHFFIYLGKKRYSEEFLLLKNKKWYFKFYLKQYYNLDFKFLFSFYMELRKKFKVKLIKDLFLFLEYNISIFTKKYIFYSFSYFYNFSNDMVVNNHSISLNNKSIFFVGDLIQMNSFDLKLKFYYEKLFIFFNIVYYISPFFFKKKTSFLLSLYNKFFIYVYKRFNSYSLLKTNFLFDKMNNNHFFYKKTNKYVRFFIKKISNHVLDNKYILKSLFFFLHKFNFLNYISTKYLSKDSFFLLDNVKTCFYIYSFDKTFYKYSLISFDYLNKQRKKRIRKPFWWFKNIKFNKRYWRRKKRNLIKKKINYNIFKFLKYQRISDNNKLKSSFYNDNILKKLNQKNYRFWLCKKMFFLNKKNKLVNFLYHSSF